MRGASAVAVRAFGQAYACAWPAGQRLLRSAGLSLAIAVGMIPAVAAASASAEQWLVRMSEAMRERAYEGRLVYLHEGMIDAFALVHGAVEGRENERMRTLTGTAFEVIRDGEEVTCVWPASARAMVSRRPGDVLPPKPPRGLDDVPPYYEATLDGDDRMAGRPARIVDVRPADTYRYGYRIWIDRATQLLLRSDLIGANGEAVERLMFTRLEPRRAVPASAFEPTLEGMTSMAHSDPEPGDDGGASPQWRARDLPPGFEAVAHRRQAMAPRGNAVQHSVFSDGLAAVSVFVEPRSAGNMPPTGMSAMGSVHAFGVRRGDHHITAVGEVPGATVERIARSVERVHER